MTRAVLSFFALALAGCAASGGAGGGAPVEFRGAGSGGRETEISSVAPDDGPLWEGEGTPLSAYALTAEEAFAEGRPSAHMVRAGETLYAIAVRTQSPLRALIEANRLEPPFALKPGQRLTLPPPARHRVAQGETLTAVARRYAVDRRSLALLNRRDPAAPLRAGETLRLPFAARAEPGVAPSEAPSRRASPEPRSVRAEAPAAARVVPATMPKDFVWPADGLLTARFGVQPGGRRSDGIDIAVLPGSIVRAAGDGTVVYSGDDLPGYGNLILVQHSGGVVTAYARLGRAKAAVGARVRKGQSIAEAGLSRLHFQIRAGGAPVDPARALPPRA